MCASDVRSLIARTPAPLLAGSLLLASVLLSAGIWSWMSLNNGPRLGTWTDTGRVIQLIGEPPEYVYLGTGESAVEDKIDLSEFDAAPQLEEGDQVTVWVASVPETAYSPYWGTYEIGDRRIIKLQSKRGAWTARDYSNRAAAARAAAQPGFGPNFQTVRWVGSIAGVLVALFVLVGLQARLASAHSGKGSPREPETLLPDATATRFSGSDRLVLGCSLGLALVVLAAAVLLSWLR
jgi:hypothetical protein